VVKVSNIPPTICVYQHTFQPGALSTVGTMSEAYNFLRLLYAKTATQFCPSHRDQAIAPASSLDIARAIRQIDAPLVRILAPAVKAKKGLHKEIFERALRSEISEVRVDGIFAKPSHFEKGLVKSRAHSIDYVIAKFNPSRMSAELIEEAVIQGLSISGGTLLVHYGSQEQVFSSERTCPICHTGFFKPDPEDLSFSSKRGACPTCEGTGLGRDDTPCSSCHGERIKPAGRNLRLEGHSITQLCNEQPNAIAGILESLSFAHHHQALAEPIIRELLAKLKRLENLSLDYLPLNRDCSTLSGGELQRLRLATAIGSPLAGVLYIFDEPSIGLHPLDNGPVIESIQSLKESGNSVILIEHDTEMIRSSDYVIEIGPGGGKNGGEIVFTGAMSSFLSAETATARALTSQHYTSESSNPQKAETFLYFSGSKNNIKTISGELPLNRLVTVAGVSGAGKSSLVHGIIAETIRDGRKIQDGFERKDCRVTASSEILEHVIEIDQKPIGANSRSTPASYLGIWDEVRKLFAAMVEAKTRGWNQSFFSYNTGKGRCPECKGLGSVTFEMTFLPDARIECESCQGKRFTEDALTVTYQGLTISEVLALTFEQALSIFAAHRKIHRPIHHVCELGLGYLSLGQSSTTLSGGEAQRLKLASEISSPRSDHTIYIFDEPTVGLHRSDVQRLLTVLRSLVGLGHSAIVIEHDGDIIRSSDYVLEIGPGPAERGGSIIFAGAPNALCKAKTPWGDVLRKQLNVPKRQRQKQKELRSQAVT
jgi:excinuclease ABC subunit A